MISFYFWKIQKVFLVFPRFAVKWRVFQRKGGRCTWSNSTVLLIYNKKTYIFSWFMNVFFIKPIALIAFLSVNLTFFIVHRMIRKTLINFTDKYSYWFKLRRNTAWYLLFTKSMFNLHFSKFESINQSNKKLSISVWKWSLFRSAPNFKLR